MSTAASQLTLVTAFSGSPDPTAVYLTPGLKAVLYKTRYAVEHRQGLAAILGDPGLGKSTLMRYLYAHFSSLPSFLCVFVPNPNFKSDFAVLKKIAGDLGVEPKRSMLQQQSEFEDWLVKQYTEGNNIVVFIDEAQKLDSEQLELVRTLLNFETDKEKLIQIVLAGNLELRDRLKLKKHKPLLSRVFAPSLISPMTLEETRGMLEVRCERESLPFPFDEASLKIIYDYSGGVPRHALRVAEFAYAQMRDLELTTITSDIVEAMIEGLKIDE
jgi:general secretion pathway protein A